MKRHITILGLTLAAIETPIAVLIAALLVNAVRVAWLDILLFVIQIVSILVLAAAVVSILWVPAYLICLYFHWKAKWKKEGRL